MNQVQQFLEYIFNMIKIWVIIQPWESALIIRNGKRIKKKNGGIYFKLPYFDSVFVQEIRLRVVSLPIQTLTTKDLKTITLNGAIAYSISDVKKLYNTLFHPEITIQNIAMAALTDYVHENDVENIKPGSIQKSVLSKLKNLDYGVNFEYFKITNFAVVRTFRIIQDQSWISEGLKMDEKKQ